MIGIDDSQIEVDLCATNVAYGVGCLTNSALHTEWGGLALGTEVGRKGCLVNMKL